VPRLRPAVFLDRDGTLNERPPEHCYVRSVHEFRWLDGAREALTALARSGFVLAVVSNQRGVARGVLTRETLLEIEALVQAELRPLGCGIEAFRYCVHDDGDRCSCRKPAPGLLLDLARDLELDLSRSWMAGDSDSDIAAGQAAGCRTRRVGGAPSSSQPDLVAGSMLEGARLIVASRAEAA